MGLLHNYKVFFNPLVCSLTMVSFFSQSVIKKKYGQDATNVGDEGGFAPNIQVNHCLLKHLGNWIMFVVPF